MTVIRPHLISAKIENVDVSDEISRIEIHATPAADEVVTFSTARQGGEYDWSVHMTILEDHSSGSLLAMALATPGAELDLVYLPIHDASPSATVPHYEATAISQHPNGKVMGGTATRSRNTTSTIEVVWPLTAKPTPKITAGP